MNELALSQSDNGRSFRVPPGTRIAIRLDENPTTGFRWTLQSIVSPILDLEYDDYTTTTTGIGGGGTRIFHFVSDAPGTQTILLNLMRPWEGEAKAVSVFSATVTVTACGS
jgi:inhibitor of cysteine peptidase